jgi:hypothetical protein
MPQKAKGDYVGQGGGAGLERERQGGNAKAYNAGEEEADFFLKEAGTMPSAVAGSDLLVVK